MAFLGVIEMDIVEQLRDYINYVDDIALRKIAADEITKLRAELAEANKTIEQLKADDFWGLDVVQIKALYKNQQEYIKVLQQQNQELLEKLK
jgi:hypothetical protein